MSELTLGDLYEQVLMANYNGTKENWAEDVLELVQAHDSDELRDEVDRITKSVIGHRVGRLKANREKTLQNKRLMSRSVSLDGKPMSPTLSVRTESGARQETLWIFASPRQYIDAVLHEQKIIDGRNDSNAIRLQVVQMIQNDDRLLRLPTLKAVCGELGIDPDTLGLDELSA